jgi:SAM-dependent methyltransferase
VSEIVTESVVDELLNSFTEAEPDSVDTKFRRLVDALWQDGSLTDLAVPAAPVLVAHVDLVGEDRLGRLLVLLGLLAETDSAVDGAMSAGVREGLDRYLALLAGSAAGEPLTLALLYLLSHFPGDRDRVLAAVQGMALDPHDLSRLDRGLQQLDRDHPDLGRVWPSPSVWALGDGERDADEGWIKELSPEQVTTNWRNDTRTVLGFSGAKAYWAVRNGAAPTLSPGIEIDENLPEIPPDPAIDIFARHGAAFRCPNCHSGLDFSADGVRCPACSTQYPIANGILDLSAGVRGELSDVTDDATSDLLEKLAAMPTMGLIYEALLRPAFLQVAGGNWDLAVTRADEDAYIAEHVHPVDGPVLDLAAGAGSWTAVVSAAVGPERVVAVDMALPMLTVLRRKLPEVPAVRATALDLPFDDGSLGAVLCWNALQAFPDDAAAAIAEMGRCLRPGGTLTLMTFSWDPDPVARHFQASQCFPARPQGLLLFEPQDIRRWLIDAGLEVGHEALPGTFLFITARRT